MKFLTLQLRARSGPRSLEPVDFDALPSRVEQYWKELYDTLPPEWKPIMAAASVYHLEFSPDWLQKFCTPESSHDEVISRLARLGWFVQISGAPQKLRYRFSARSARNAIRQIAGSAAIRELAADVILNETTLADVAENAPLELLELRRLAGRLTPENLSYLSDERTLNPPDAKLLAWHKLDQHRKLRRMPTSSLADIDVQLARLFGHMGSIARRKRWASAALQHLSAEQQFRVATPELVGQWRSILDATHDVSLSRSWVERALTLTPRDHHAVRGVLLSELGALRGSTEGLKQGLPLLFQAKEELRRSPEYTAAEARNLYRIGSFFGQMRRTRIARQYLQTAVTKASHSGTDEGREVLWRATANLGWVHRLEGEPRAALAYFRKVANRWCRMGSFDKYPPILTNMVTCYVDAGLGSRALAVAQLAKRVALSISDDEQLSYAAQNLSWVYWMQGQLGASSENVETAERIRTLLGDKIGAAHARLNLARAWLMAGQCEHAVRICDDVLLTCLSAGDHIGVWDCRRLLAKLAIESGDYGRAVELLDLIPNQHADLLPRDVLEGRFLRLAILFWTGDVSATEPILCELSGEPQVRAIHGFACDFELAQGIQHLLKADYHGALDHLGSAATLARSGARLDKFLDAVPALALLAARIGNRGAALQYLNTSRSARNRMREELR